MDFRFVLNRLYDYRANGASNFNSDEVSNLFSISKAQSSKYLSRLHQMGFLKRSRHKRLCLSKNGRLCNKGYFYAYEFSKQGEQYVRWMSTGRSVEIVRYYDLVEKLLPYLSKQVKDEIVNIAMSKDQSRYKGSNQALQTVGYIIHAFPSISKTLKETINRNDFLETENKKLNLQINELKSKRKEIEKQNNDLETRLSKIELENKKLESRHLKLSQTILMQNKMDFHRNATYKITNTIDGEIIKDFSEILLLRDFDSGLKTIKGIYKRYDNGRKIVKEHMNKAVDASKKIQMLSDQKEMYT